MQLVWTEPAGTDLDSIESYISQDNSPAVAVEVVLDILNAVETILLTHPNAGRPGRRSGTRELVVTGLPYVVVYRQRLQVLEVLRVLHDAQQWLPRRR